MDISYYKKFEPIDGKWYITRELGRGAFGTVFEVERREFGESMKSAMKIITVPPTQNDILSYREDNFDLDDKSVASYFYGFVEEFVQEYQLMHKLRGHSNIVSYEDHTVKKREDEIGWDIFIRMELLTPMSKYFAEHHISTTDVIRLGIDICKALEMCQKYHIIHRDIKPSNIFVSNAGDFKLGDFGIARTLEKTSSGLSKKGTYTYMAPEVFKGDEYGSTVDIYSLGIVMYRLLNNNVEPFREDRGHSGEEIAMIKRMHGEKIPKPANADGTLAEIVLKACSFDPHERFKTASEMRQELEKELENVQNNGFGTDEKKEEKEIIQTETFEENGLTNGIFEKVEFEEETDKTVSLYGEDNSLAFDDVSFESGMDIGKTVGIFSESENTKNENSEPEKNFQRKKVLYITIIAIILMLIFVGTVYINSLRGRLVGMVPESFEMEENMSVDFLSEIYSAKFWDGNINRKISVDTSLINGICVVEEYEDGITLTALKPGTAQIGVSVNGSDFRQVDITVYEKIDKSALLQNFMDAESFLKTVKEDAGINQDNVTYEKQVLEGVINTYGDIHEKINKSSSSEIVEYKTLYQTKIIPAVEALKKAYEVAQGIENEKKCDVCGSTTHQNHYQSKSKTKCSVCGSSAHTVHSQSKSPNSGSTDHTTQIEAKCPTCGSTAHAIHPDDLYIPPF